MQNNTDNSKRYVYGVIKNYDHSLGLSVCFRQWADKSHCHFLHGYAIKVLLEFASFDLDERNWVVPFGELKSVKQYLVDNFDHKTIIAATDPELETFKMLNEKGLIDMIIVPAVSVEMFAKIIFEKVIEWLDAAGDKYGNVVLKKVSVSEHGANCAYYEDSQWLETLKGN